ncbi:aspartoacylase [Synechococcus sp. CC9616]|uniref:aspartoacylase n=1 Tax=Synechococcus sp. CC9616 TaxID=110663 RepID=UPI00048DC094|nr:aspartoacylase [Synechococcus sp. CC9616]
MTASDVLLVAATHGNELNAAWLLEQWQQQPSLLDDHGLGLQRVIGNPAARNANRRYVDRDLNRSFQQERLDDQHDQDCETVRARELVTRFGPQGQQPCCVALDLHSTTAAMGSCLVLYGRRPADLALASIVQGKLGLPVYLHEADAAQTGFLVERWPCGLVIEVGPVPQSLLDARIVRQTRLAVEACLSALSEARDGVGRTPRQLVVHRHLSSRDLPRNADGQPSALVNPAFLGRNWLPSASTASLFETAAGGELPVALPAEASAAVFINEAAYAEKGIALSLTAREVWPVEPTWRPALEQLIRA